MQFSAIVGTSVVSHSTTVQPCGSDNNDQLYSNFLYMDANQTIHIFNGIYLDADGCIYPPGSVTRAAADNSGYKLIATSPGLSVDVYDVAGNHVANVVNAGTSAVVKDPDGNSISMSYPCCTYTDTLGQPGQPVLTFNNNNTYSYTDALGKTRSVTVNYSSYTEQTHFGWCGGADYGPWSASLPSSISMPDGSSYGITYETTPGFPNSVTGRITKITLPTGGSISYSYTGGSYGLDCSSLYVPLLTRTLTNSDGSTAVWKYDGQTLPAPQVLVTDPYNNETVYTFGTAIPNYGELNYGLESQKLIYSGSHTGTPVETAITCYNGNTTNCATTSPQAGVPITEKDTMTTMAGMTSNLVETEFDSNGNHRSEEIRLRGTMPPTGRSSLRYRRSAMGS